MKGFSIVIDIIYYFSSLLNKQFKFFRSINTPAYTVSNQILGGKKNLFAWKLFVYILDFFFSLSTNIFLIDWALFKTSYLIENQMKATSMLGTKQNTCYIRKATVNNRLKCKLLLVVAYNSILNLYPQNYRQFEHYSRNTQKKKSSYFHVE